MENQFNKADLMGKYKLLAADLEKATINLSETHLDFRPDNKWSIRQHVHHIVDSDAIVKTVMLAAIGNSGCSYSQSWYDIDNTWADTMAYDKREIFSAVSLFRANIVHLDTLLQQKPQAWENFVNFIWIKDPEGKKISVEYLVRSRINHGRHHIDRILEIRDMLNAHK